MKKEIRKRVLNLRNELTVDMVQDKSQCIYNTIVENGFLNKPQIIMLYMDFRNEVKTLALIHHVLDQNKILVLPRIDMKTKTMTLHRVNSLANLERSKFGILEPAFENIVQEDEVDLILSPGVAFDKNCYRLGYGGGFYDRLLSKKRKEVPVIALAFDLQIIAKVPTEPHDIKVDYIVTESRVIKQLEE